MKKELFEQYEAITKQIKALELEADELKPQLIAEMDAEDIETASTNTGTFYFTERKVWTYPEGIVEAESQLKAQKKKAEMMGEAKFEVNRIFAFRAIKEDKNGE